MVVPIPDLAIGNRHQGQQDRDADAGKQRRGKPFFRDPFGCAPTDHYEQADQRQIGIPIGHCLSAHLHQSNHGNQRPQEPEPTYGKIALASGRDDPRGHREQEKKCSPDLPRIQRISRIGIERRKA